MFEILIANTASMAKQLMHVPHVQEEESLNSKGRPNLTKHCKRFTITSTSMQVAVLPWCYDVEMGTANSLHAST